MLSVEIDEKNGIAVLEPSGPLSKNDFELATKTIDPYIEKAGKLNGLIIHVESFPGWESFAALSSHLSFVKQHHKRISRVAFATDSALADVAEKISSHFVNAKIKAFPYKDIEQARNWVISDA